MRLWWILIPVLLLDRATKVLASRFLSEGAALPVIPGVIQFTFAKNMGAAFSMLSGASFVVSIVSLLLIAGVVWYLLRHPEAGVLSRTGLWMVAAGGMGNLFDRIAYGYVVDFIEPLFINFAVFNVADIAVCVGAALVFLGEIRKETKKHEV